MFLLDQNVINNAGETGIIVDFIKGSKEVERKMLVKFNEGSIVTVTSSNLCAGKFKNPMSKKVYGVGFIGEGLAVSSINSVEDRAYTMWNSMIERCYGKNQKKSYTNVKVHSDWHNYQNFHFWVKSQTGYAKENFELDKDLLKQGNTLYHAELCCLIPKEINLAIASKRKSELPTGVSLHSTSKNRYRARLNRYGKEHHLGLFSDPQDAFKVYKANKEQYLKELAYKWKEEIDAKAYIALMNYCVN